jgi:hypothetical protein
MFRKVALALIPLGVGCAHMKSAHIRSIPFILLINSLACVPATAPPTRETLVLRGTPYERGLEHGTKLKSKVHSFYTTLLTNSLIPYLSREQPDIASLLKEYEKPKYQNGAFGYELLLDSAKSMERSLTPAMKEEMKGIADGSELSYDQVLILNTFVDSVLAVRGVALAIRYARAPLIESVTFVGAENDAQDNDGDGMVDEPNEQLIKPYSAELTAQAVELPATVKFEIVLKDTDGVDPTTVRLYLRNELFTTESPEVKFEVVDATRLKLVLTPRAPLPLTETVTLAISAGDKVIRENPAPARASFMRDEEIVFTVRGANKKKYDVLRPVLTDGRTRPPPFGIAVRGSASNNQILMAQHFSLLDANTAHKHTVLLEHHTESGASFVTIGWAGTIFGLSALSSKGFGYVCNPSDSLDNSVLGGVIENIADLSVAKLVAKGMPIGLVGRTVLENATDVASAKKIIDESKHAYGWACALADKSGAIEAVEVDSDIFKSGIDVVGFSAGEKRSSGGYFGSVRNDDVVIGSSYAKNVEDILTIELSGQRIVPQRQWSGFFHRSRRVIGGAMRRLDASYGNVTVESLEQLISDPELVDASDSMNAVVLDVLNQKVYSAMGTVPATASEFVMHEVSP